MNYNLRIFFVGAASVCAVALTGCAQQPQAWAPQAAPIQAMQPPQPTSQSPLLRNIPAGHASGQGDYLELNASGPGQPVDIYGSLAFGKQTIVEFWSPYCGPCMALRPHIQRLAAQRPDLAVRSINVNRPEVQGIDWRSPVIDDNPYVRRGLPYFMIYGPDRKLELEGQAATEAVVECLQQQARSARQTR